MFTCARVRLHVRVRHLYVYPHAYITTLVNYVCTYYIGYVLHALLLCVIVRMPVFSTYSEKRN